MRDLTRPFISSFLGCSCAKLAVHPKWVVFFFFVCYCSPIKKQGGTPNEKANRKALVDRCTNRRKRLSREKQWLEILSASGAHKVEESRQVAQWILLTLYPKKQQRWS